MDCSATVFVDEFSIFSTFSVILLVLGHPERQDFGLHFNNLWRTNPEIKRHRKVIVHSLAAQTLNANFLKNGFTDFYFTYT
jgi:hypothetical protein